MRRDPLDVAAVQAGEARHLRIVDQVADAAVDHAAVRARGPGGEVLLLDQHGAQAAHGGVAGDAGAVHPAADDEQVVAPHGRILAGDRVGARSSCRAAASQKAAKWD